MKAAEENKGGWGWETIENERQFSRSAADRVSYSYLILAVSWRVISSWKWCPPVEKRLLP